MSFDIATALGGALIGSVIGWIVRGVYDTVRRAWYRAKGGIGIGQ